MSDYRETVKSMDKTRGYMRDFYIYGFRTRREFTSRSARTYDNERRRIESWLGGFIDFDYSERGKSVCISVDSGDVLTNPLFVAWKRKSFTSNDITLHFLLLDLLSEGSFSAPELTELLSARYGVTFELQTVRGKLREYEAEGLLTGEKDGRSLKYSLSSCFFESLPHSEPLLDAVAFFSETTVGGYLGSSILDRYEKYKRIFRFKHHFIAHTLDDGLALELLDIMRSHRRCELSGVTRRSPAGYNVRGVPLRILTSVQTGRRYVTFYNERAHRLTNLRLDSLTEINALPVCERFEELSEAARVHSPRSWAVSFDGSRRIEQLCMKLRINESTERYVLERIQREGRGGELLKIDKNTFLYTVEVYDTNEVMPWVKTFIGRIISLEGTNRAVVDKFYSDIERMRSYYGTGEG